MVPEEGKEGRVRFVRVAILVSVLLSPASVLHGQMPRSTRAGFSLGAFVSFPEPFLPEYCEQDAVAATGTAGVGLTSGLRLEAQAVASSGWGGMTCAIPGLAAPAPGSVFDRHTFADNMEGMSFLASILTVVGEITPGARSSARGRVGVGRIWRKGLGLWTVGLGYRFDVGSGRVSVDADRWSLAVPFLEERILVGQQGEWLVQSSAERKQAEHPILIRLGYEVRVR
jgi:hypothetical protein